MPPSRDEASLNDDEFVVPEDPVEQERFKRRLMAMEPNNDLVHHEARDSKVSDSLPDSEPPAPPPIESDWAPIMEFTAADIFQHSPLGDILSSLKCLSLSGEPWPECGQDGWDADD